MAEELTITQEELDQKIAEAVEKATGKLAEKNESLLDELKNARKRVEAFKDFDPEDVRKALQGAKDLKKQAQEALADRGEYEKALAKATEQHQAELQKMQQQLEKAQGTLKTMVVDQALNQAMDKAGIAQPFRKAVAAMHRGDVSLIEKDGELQAVVGDKAPVEFLTEWAGTDEGKNFVQASGAGGGGAGGGKGKGTGGELNPWAPDTRNLTRQGQLERDNPALAAQLKREAGAEAA